MSDADPTKSSPSIYDRPITNAPLERDTMEELIERLGNDDEGDDELNVAVWRYIHPEQVSKLEDELKRMGYVPTVGLLANNCDDFTGSIDDAETLLPEGWHVTGAYWDDERATFNLTNRNNEPGSQYRSGHAATPALALCIAALKARKQP